MIASMVAWFVVNNLSALTGPGSSDLGLYDCCCLLGYCQVPLILHAIISLVLPRYAPSISSILSISFMTHCEVVSSELWKSCDWKLLF